MREKDAYNAYAYRMGLSTAWEHLSDSEQLAWREVVKAATDEPTCDDCGCAITCVRCWPAFKCRPAKDPECEECGDDMLCPSCNLAELIARLPKEQTAVASATGGVS